MANLNLSGSKGDGSLRLDPKPAVNASDVAPINANLQAAQSAMAASQIEAAPLLDFQNDVGGSIANIIGAVASGARGDTQFAARKRQERLQAAQIKRDNLTKGNDFASKLLLGGRGLTGDQRAKYRESASTAINKLGIPQLSEMFEANFDQPEITTTFTEAFDQTPLAQQLLKQDPTGESLLKFKTTPEGQKRIEQLADETYLGSAQSKINTMTQSLDALVRSGHIDEKLLKKVQADGKVSVAEIRQLSESMPEGIEMKLTPEELSSATANRNLEGLRAIGISLAEDFEPEDLKGSGKTVTDLDGNIAGTLVTTDSKGIWCSPQVVVLQDHLKKVNLSRLSATMLKVLVLVERPQVI